MDHKSNIFAELSSLLPGAAVARCLADLGAARGCRAASARAAERRGGPRGEHHLQWVTWGEKNMGKKHGENMGIQMKRWLELTWGKVMEKWWKSDSVEKNYLWDVESDGKKTWGQYVGRDWTGRYWDTTGMGKMYEHVLGRDWMGKYREAMVNIWGKCREGLGKYGKLSGTDGKPWIEHRRFTLVSSSEHGGSH